MLVNRNGKLVVVDEEDIEINEEQLKKDAFEFIKKLEFNTKTFNWYILTRKNTSDFTLYRNIINKKNLKKTYAQIVKNTRKQGNWKMKYDDLLELYLSKRFNQQILKPMCKQAFKHNWKAVNQIALLK